MYNAFWSIKSFCIYQQGVVDVMHSWSLGLLDYVIESNIYEVLKYLRSFKLAAARRRPGRDNRAENGGAGEEYSPQLFSEAFIRRLFTEGVTKTVMNIEQNTACLVLPKKARLRLGKIASYLMVVTNGGQMEAPGTLQASTNDCLGQCLPVIMENLLDIKVKTKESASNRSSFQPANDIIHKRRRDIDDPGGHRDPTPRIVAATCSLLWVRICLPSL